MLYDPLTCILIPSTMHNPSLKERTHAYSVIKAEFRRWGRQTTSRCANRSLRRTCVLSSALLPLSATSLDETLITWSRIRQPWVQNILIDLSTGWLRDQQRPANGKAVAWMIYWLTDWLADWLRLIDRPANGNSNLYIDYQQDWKSDSYVMLQS